MANVVDSFRDHFTVIKVVISFLNCVNRLNLIQGAHGFEELRKYIKQGGDFSKEVHFIIQERYVGLLTSVICCWVYQNVLLFSGRNQNSHTLKACRNQRLNFKSLLRRYQERQLMSGKWLQQLQKMKLNFISKKNI